MDKSSKNKQRLVIVIMLCLISVIILASVAFGYHILFTKKYTPPSTPAPTLIVAAHPAAASWKQNFETFGTVYSRNGVDVSAEMDGRITKITPTGPRLVHKGDLLFQVFNEQAKGRLESEKSKLHYAETNLSRKRRLLHQGAISRNEYDVALQDYKTALGNVTTAEGSLSLTNIYAPITGYTSIIQPSVGNYIKSGDTLVHITPLNSMYIKFSIPAFFAPTIKLGDKVTFTNPALNNKTETAILSEIDNKVDIDTRQITLKARFKNTTPKLLPGDFVDLSIQVGKLEKLLVVPNTAIKYQLTGTYLYKIINNKAQEIPITIKQNRGQQTGITSKSLSPTDTIVADGTTKITNGSLVKAAPDHESN